MSVFISTNVYDRIKDGEDIEIVVEARDRTPMSVCVCPVLYDDAKYKLTVDVDKED